MASFSGNVQTNQSSSLANTLNYFSKLFIFIIWILHNNIFQKIFHLCCLHSLKIFFFYFCKYHSMFLLPHKTGCAKKNLSHTNPLSKRSRFLALASTTNGIFNPISWNSLSADKNGTTKNRWHVLTKNSQIFIHKFSIIPLKKKWLLVQLTHLRYLRF